MRSALQLLTVGFTNITFWVCCITVKPKQVFSTLKYKGGKIGVILVHRMQKHQSVPTRLCFIPQDLQ